MTAESHNPATCPAFGGCNDCRSAKFEAASPDVEIGGGEVAEWKMLAADPVDYAGVPAFNAAADATLARAGAVHSQRGDEYGDTWALENMMTTYLDSVLDALCIRGFSRAEKRLILIAALIDVKDSRMLGAWKLDTVDDGINYRAAFATWREEYKEATGA